MSHRAELNVHGCSLRVFVWYQTLPLTPLLPLKLCNYSNYGLSNTPDACMTMPERLESAEDQYLCTAAAAARLSDNSLPTSSLAYAACFET